MGQLDGRVALITGGASGIGLATAHLLRAEGARLAIADLREPEAGLADLAVTADVADASVWPGLVAQVEEALGGLDVVHLNAGITCNIADVTAVDDESYRRLMRVNVDHVFFGLRAGAAAMERGGGGRIVATASLAGLTGFGVDPVYTLTKHAVVGLVRGCAGNLAERGVVVNAVCPGIVDTPLLGDAERQALLDAGFPMLAAEEIAAAVLRAAVDGGPGDCWYVQPGRAPEPFRFGRVPGPRIPGKEGVTPPLR